jgi:hypothetical protein
VSSRQGDEGSIPLFSAKDKMAEWLRQRIANPFFMSSNLILVSTRVVDESGLSRLIWDEELRRFESYLSDKMEVLSNWLARLTVNQVSSEHVGSNPTTSTMALWFYQSTRLSLELFVPNSRNQCHETGKITTVVYPPWTREVAGSNPASQTKLPCSVKATHKTLILGL